MLACRKGKQSVLDVFEECNKGKSCCILKFCLDTRKKLLSRNGQQSNWLFPVGGLREQDTPFRNGFGIANLIFGSAALIFCGSIMTCMHLMYFHNIFLHLILTIFIMQIVKMAKTLQISPRNFSKQLGKFSVLLFQLLQICRGFKELNLVEIGCLFV